MGGLFIIDGHVMLIIDYHKGQNQSEAPRVIPYILPVDVG